jgi:hypothetical protein
LLNYCRERSGLDEEPNHALPPAIILSKEQACFMHPMAAQRDFQEQKGRLQEELEVAGQEVIFYPKFHCELNFIEKIWCSCKAYTRDYYTFTIQGLQKILPEAIKSVSTATINRYYHRCMSTFDVYFTGHTCGSMWLHNLVFHKPFCI